MIRASKRKLLELYWKKYKFLQENLIFFDLLFKTGIFTKINRIYFQQNERKGILCTFHPIQNHSLGNMGKNI